jgi:hypothetical protein
MSKKTVELGKEEDCYLNRSERRAKIRFLTKELSKHQVTKPTRVVTPDSEESEDEMVYNVNKVRAWLTRDVIIRRKIEDLKNKNYE